MPDRTYPHWDAVRDLDAKPFRAVCYAPFTSLEFDTQGFAFTCCANGIYPVGDITRHRLREIWTGARIVAQRDAMKRGDLDLGCTVCKWYLGNGKSDPLAGIYEGLPVSSDEPEWPVSLAFSFSNQCNLQCVQCSGEYSSSIRAHREGRPALPRLYGDDFFEQLDEFLPHARMIRLMGGEPFLVSENFRLFERLEQLDLRPAVHVTTNGTRFDDRVARAFETLSLSVHVSIDAVTPEVLEATRVGCDAETVLANARRFRELTREAGTDFGINFCFMEETWRELPGVLALGDELDAPVSVITVHTGDHSLSKLGIDQVEHIVAELTEIERRGGAPTGRNAGVWHTELTQLRAVAADLRDGRVAPILDPRRAESKARIAERRHLLPVPGGAEAGTGATTDPVGDLRRWAVDGSVIEVLTDADDIVLSATVLTGPPPPGVEPVRWVDAPFVAAVSDMSAAWGESAWMIEDDVTGARLDQLIAFSPNEYRDKEGLVARCSTTARPGGGWRTVIGVDPSFTGATDPSRAQSVPVSLGGRRR